MQKTLDPLTQNVNVYARFRPGQDEENHIILDEEYQVKRDFEKRKFHFNRVFKDQKNSQELVFDIVGKNIVESVLMGYNGSILAYGQTGTGKTFTMIGNQDGILPKSVDHILEKKQEQRLHLFIAAIQIYNDSLSDMLDEECSELKVKDAKRHQVFDCLKWKEIQTKEDARVCFETAARTRFVGSTTMNDQSSRSHAIFMLRILNRDSGRKSTLYLVDLAGSERIKKSHVSGERVDEAIAINSSLTTLGKCIIALSEKKISHIPFRESKLTKILKDALGGNCKTALIISLSPDIQDIDETISSLLFGQRAKKVQCKPMFLISQELKNTPENYKELQKQLEMKNNILQKLTNENNQLNIEKESKLLLLPKWPGSQINTTDWECRQKIPTSAKDHDHKLMILKKEHQSRLEDMDNIMLRQEQEIQKLKAKVQGLEQDNADLKNQLIQKALQDTGKRSLVLDSDRLGGDLDDLQHIKEYLKKEISRVKLDREKLDADRLCLKKEWNQLEIEKENIEMERVQMEKFSEEYEGKIMMYEEKIRKAETGRELNQSRSKNSIHSKNAIDSSPASNSKMQELQKRIDELSKTCQNFQILMNDRDAAIETLKKESDTLRQESLEHEKLLSEAEDSKEEIENKCFELQIEKQTLIEEVEVSKKKISALRSELELLRSSQGKDENLEVEYLAAVEDINKLKLQVQDMKSEISRRDKKDAETDNALLMELEKERQRSSQLIAERTEQRAAVQNYKTQTDAIQQEVEFFRTQAATKEKLISDLKSRIQSLESTSINSDIITVKSKILDSINWNLASGKKQKMLNLVDIAKTKLNGIVKQGKLETKSDPLVVAEMVLCSSKEDFREVIFKQLKSQYFGDFYDRIDNSQNIKEVIGQLVGEVQSSRRCIEELILSIESLVWSYMEKEVQIKQHEERSMTLKNQLERFKSVVNDPLFEELRQHFYKIWMTQLRRERAIKVIQKAFRKIVQKLRMKSLQKRHRTQYELFQAGSGKYLLQTLMKKTESIINGLSHQLVFDEQNSQVSRQSSAMKSIHSAFNFQSCD